MSTGTDAATMSQEVFAALPAETKFEIVEPLIRRAVQYHTSGNNPSDQEDALQEALIQVWVALTEPTHHAYATAQTATRSWLIKRGVLYARSHLQVIHRQITSRNSSMEVLAGVDEGTFAIDDIYNLSEWSLDEVLRDLPELAQKIGRMLSAGYNQRAIAAELGSTPVKICREVERSLRPAMAPLVPHG